MKLLAVLILALLTGCTTLRETAHTAVAADALTTGAGLLIGAGTEVNPLITSIPMGLATVAVRVGAVEIANRQDEPTRTTALAGVNAVTWGVVANNLAVIASKWAPWITSHLAIASGIGFGWLIWEATADKRELARLCAMHRQTHPDLRC